MNANAAIQRSQAYAFLSNVFLYPKENWMGSLADFQRILEKMNIEHVEFEGRQHNLEDLQSFFRLTFGATGSLCYETEIGLANEFSQSQEMADISGFYRAFGFELGGIERERPDHAAVELEFMYLLCLKEAYAINQGMDEQAEICIDAQSHFIQDHLGRWFDLLSKNIKKNGDALYADLAQAASNLIDADIKRLNIEFSSKKLKDATPTPFDPNFSCDDCKVPEHNRLIMPTESIS